MEPFGQGRPGRNPHSAVEEPGRGTHLGDTVHHEEPLYTLTEAQDELARRQCRTDGHDFRIIHTRSHDDPAGTPVGVTCDRCQTHWDVVRSNPRRGHP